MGVRPKHRFVHRGARRRLGLHALHNDFASRWLALLADTAVRSRGVGRCSKAVRLLSDHAADADALHHHSRTVPDARFDQAIRHHLSDDPGRTGRYAACLPGPRLSRLLSVYERRKVRRASDHPVGHDLRAVERLHQTMVETARTRPRSGLRREAALEHMSVLERGVRGVLIALIVLFFLFPIFWIFLMSFQTNEDILRIPPSLFFTPTLSNYAALITGKLVSNAGTLDIAFMKNLWNSVLLSTASVVIALILGVPAAYAFARFKFRLGEDIAFTLLSFRFAPPLLVLLPLSLYFQQLGLTDTYIGLIWVYQLIALPLILWIVRGYFEDLSPDIEYAYRVAGHSWWRTFTRIAIPLAGPGIAAAGLLA